jgi:hypothetical protein
MEEGFGSLFWHIFSVHVFPVISPSHKLKKVPLHSIPTTNIYSCIRESIQTVIAQQVHVLIP